MSSGLNALLRPNKPTQVFWLTACGGEYSRRFPRVTAAMRPLATITVATRRVPARPAANENSLRLTDMCCLPDLSSKPAGRRCCCRSMGQTDGHTDTPVNKARDEGVPLRKFTCYMGSHSVTCYLTAVTFPPLLQPKLVLDLVSSEGCKAELT